MNETKKAEDQTEVSPPAHDMIDLAPKAEVVVSPPYKALPAIIEHQPPSRRAVWARRLAILALIGGGGGFLYWQAHRAPALPAWIVMAMAGSKPIRSTSTPNSPAASRSFAPTRATW